MRNGHNGFATPQLGSYSCLAPLMAGAEINDFVSC
jgi:hypothetical protein